MRPKERVLTAFASQVPDRVPINYAANAGIDRRLKAHFGLRPDDDEGLRRALHVDFRQVGVPYVGPKLHPDDPARGVVATEWGIHMRWVEHSTGGYWDYCDFPLKDADEEAVANWPLPSPDDYDYSQVFAFCQAHRDFAIAAGGPGMAPKVQYSTSGMCTSANEARFW